ncbi:unnamed protein product, partial [Ectocarpus sp. 13 AM-2016]
SRVGPRRFGDRLVSRRRFGVQTQREVRCRWHSSARFLKLVGPRTSTTGQSN